MKLIGTKTSPYVRKVRVVLAEKALAFEFVEESAWAPDTRVPLYNPLNKVPALVTDSGERLYDSVVIAEYLDALGAPALIPAAGLERANVRRLEALGDGISDAGVTVFMERKREPAKQDEAWIARQMSKVEAGLAALSHELGDRPWLAGSRLTLGDIAAGCALFWLAFRMPEVDWRGRYPNLDAWARRLESRPSFSSTIPVA